jgi:cyclopropane fatty-acyl-phospholipid synthase-like methyltransferase
MANYLEENRSYWSRGYAADNVDAPAFRFYGRILKNFGPHEGRLLDFGCGAGAALRFFLDKGYDSYGVDISDTDLATARERDPAHADRYLQIDPAPSADDTWFGGDFDIVMSIQVLYLLGEQDMQTRLESLHAQLKPGGIFYATMMGSKSWWYGVSEPIEQGMRRVTLPESHGGGSTAVLFTDSEEQLLERFSMFEPLHVGFYSEKFRADEGPGFHYSFVGRRR